MIFSWTLLEKRPNPKTLKRFAVPHLLAKSTASEMRIYFTRLFKVFYGRMLIYGTPSSGREGDKR